MSASLIESTYELLLVNYTVSVTGFLRRQSMFSTSHQTAPADRGACEQQ